MEHSGMICRIPNVQLLHWKKTMTKTIIIVNKWIKKEYVFSFFFRLSSQTLYLLHYRVLGSFLFSLAENILSQPSLSWPSDKKASSLKKEIILWLFICWDLEIKWFPADDTARIKMLYLDIWKLNMWILL